MYKIKIMMNGRTQYVASIDKYYVECTEKASEAHVFASRHEANVAKCIPASVIDKMQKKIFCGVVEA
jgi:hypothetical protein